MTGAAGELLALLLLAAVLAAAATPRRVPEAAVAVPVLASTVALWLSLRVVGT